jgi:hypothetical protein
LEVKAYAKASGYAFAVQENSDLQLGRRAMLPVGSLREPEGEQSNVIVPRGVLSSPGTARTKLPLGGGKVLLDDAFRVPVLGQRTLVE